MIEPPVRKAVTHRHKRPNTADSAMYGHAVQLVYEKSDGSLWATNFEYETQVSYCPFCGYKPGEIDG